jgi:predicted ArsR family transcriptional regulator
MQQTRRHILDILKEQKEATIDEIVKALSERIGKITAVTVRHHLEILRGDGLVAAPTVRRRSAPGRPQYVYALTERAADHFPNNYQGLASGLLEEMKTQLPASRVREILEGVAGQMAEAAMVPDGPLAVRLEHAVAFLNSCGYTASWMMNGGNPVLSVSNCPYEQVSCSNPELCKMDETLIQSMIGVSTKRLTSQLDGKDACTYVFSNDN